MITDIPHDFTVLLPFIVEVEVLASRRIMRQLLPTHRQMGIFVTAVERKVGIKPGNFP